MPTGRDVESGRSHPSTELWLTCARLVSNLHHYLGKDYEDVRGLKLVHKGGGSFMAILTAYDSEGGPIVCFGSGETYIDALRGLNASLSKGDWKPDKFATR